MCGIVGYIGGKDATPIILNGLENWNTVDTILLGLLIGRRKN